MESMDRNIGGSQSDFFAVPIHTMYLQAVNAVVFESAYATVELFTSISMGENDTFRFEYRPYGQISTDAVTSIVLDFLKKTSKLCLKNIP